MTDARFDRDEVLDELALLAEGATDARSKHASALAEDAELRDLVFDAEQLVVEIPDAGADYRPDLALEERMMARLDHREATRESSASSTKPEEKAQNAPATIERKPQSMAPMLALLAVAGFVGLSFVGGAAWLYSQRSMTPTVANASEGWSGTIEAAFPDSAGAKVDGPSSTELHAGQTIRTDDRTRARLRMSDGTMIFLDASTALRVEADGRHARVLEGLVVADVAHLDGAAPVVFSTPEGRVEVLGTKLAITAAEDSTTVKVLRGRVRIAGESGSSVDLDAGDEGTLVEGSAPTRAKAGSFAEFGDIELDSRAGADVPGLGELRARRPGERQEQERPLTLEEHSVNVRIIGPIARTEIEEVFRNDDEATLEGVYRFPIPDGARIASLSLEVEGRWETGAFVTKDRARRIFEGVIANATPRPTERRPTEELIWVPGPWRDPALLEWQRGGRFELRIFPIPGKSVRRIRLAYEQNLAVTDTGRRYVYPLPSVRRGESRVGRFRFDARIAGATSIASSGYTLSETQNDGASELSFVEESFSPKGSLIVEYGLERSDAELRTYAYRGAGAVAPGAQAREDEPVRTAQSALAADARSYVSFALRPSIPNDSRFVATDYTLVVDGSQSMTGERFARARALTASFVSELDRRHRVRVLVCDLGCRALEGGFETPSTELRARIARALEETRPMGSSNLLASLQSAAKRDDSSSDRPHGVFYVGDGMSSVGVTDIGTLEAEISDLASNSQMTVNTVGIGEDADSRALASIARGGGGYFVPFLPGQSESSAALAVLETTFGASLEHPELILPEGLEAVAPSELGTIRHGDEIIVNARYAGAIRGEAVLRGKLAGRPYERRFPIALDAEPSSINAFVPRTWANARIDDLDASNAPTDRAEAIALSKGYGVLSRDTSLLVLESEAMVRAYGIDRTDDHVQFRGDALDEDVAEAIPDEANDASAARGASAASSESEAPRSSVASSGAVAAPAPRREARAADRAFPPAPMMGLPIMGGPGSFRRFVWVRDARIDPRSTPSERDLEAVASSKAALDAAPNSRDRTRDHARALSKAGRLEEALEIAEAWLSRDPNDVEALVLSSDLVGRLGRSEESLRRLAGAVDAEPGNVAMLERLAVALDRAGRNSEACAFRLAISIRMPRDPSAASKGEACANSLHLPHAAESIRQGIEGVARRLDARSGSGEGEIVRGEVFVEATSSGGAVEVSLITPRGERASWLGGPRGTSARPAIGGGAASVAIRSARLGAYVIELSRAPGVSGTIRGELRVRALGTTRTIPYVLTDSHQAVARVVVSRHREFRPF